MDSNNRLDFLIFNKLSALGLFIGIAAIVLITVINGIPIGMAVAFIPVAILFFMIVLKNPYWAMMALFLFNYFVIAIMRYTGTSGLSVAIDIFILITFLSILINILLHRMPLRDKSGRELLFVSAIWGGYCCLELLNPRSTFEGWYLSRGLIYYFFAISGLTLLLFNRYKDIKIFLYVLSVLTLLGVAKGIMQKYIGFDYGELRFLNEGGYKTHLLSTGARFFSFYVSAGIFGVVMGHAAVVFGISAFYVKSNVVKIYFIIVAALSIYAMLISGTRGALAVPFAGLALFIVLSKRIRLIIPSTILLVSMYLFLAFTTIGQSNGLIRRARTVFDPNEPSLMVRKANQLRFKEYLADKPFGEGLGLSGVDTDDAYTRFTTSIPTDSWYVKIWVETGIVGLLLHIAILVYILVHGSYIIFFKIKDSTLKGLLSALLCGVFGILVSSYGNQVLGQFPVVFIIYISVAFVFMGKSFDKQIADQNKL